MPKIKSRHRHTPRSTYECFKDRVSGSGVQKLARPTPRFGLSWIYIDRKARVAWLTQKRDEARDIGKNHSAGVEAV